MLDYNLLHYLINTGRPETDVETEFVINTNKPNQQNKLTKHNLHFSIVQI